jgi:hypothetical protein
MLPFSCCFGIIWLFRVVFQLSLWCPQRMKPLSQPPCTRTSLPPDYHENHLNWVDSSLIVFFELILSLLASDKKDQPPPPDCLENLLIWVDLIKMIPLALPSMSRECIVGPLINPDYHFFKTNPRMTVQPCIFTLCLLYCVLYLIWVFAVYSFRIGDQLIMSLCIIVILEMYSRYFNPVTGNLNPLTRNCTHKEVTTIIPVKKHHTSQGSDLA